MKRTNEEVRERSGTISSDDPLVLFFYTLIRDELPAGKVEALVTEAVNSSAATFTNGYLATYAIDLATSIRAGDLDREKLLAWTRGRIELNEEAIAQGEGDAGPLDDRGEKIIEGALAAYGRLLTEVDSGRLDVKELS